MTEPLDVVAAVIVHNGKALACRRRPDRSAGGKWEFPGGKVEPGEVPSAALQREIREELNTDIEVRDLLTRDDTKVGPRTIRLTCFMAAAIGPLPTASTDHDELRWVPIAELAALDWALPDLPAVRALMKTEDPD